MKKTVEIKLPKGSISEIEKLDDGTLKVIIKLVEEEEQPKISDELLTLIEAEKLSLDDAFMQYKPKTTSERRTKFLIEEVIREGVKNFYRPIIDPSFTETSEDICFEKGKKPAVGRCYNWWKKVSEEYWPERNSHLGTKLQYAAFLGVLIKKLVEEGKTVEWAWNAVCNDSKELGHYCNSEDAKFEFEPTGSRIICGFYDLINVYKILEADAETDGYWRVGGYCFNFGTNPPLAYFDYNRDCNIGNSGVGWLVLS